MTTEEIPTSDIPSLEDLGVNENDRISLIDTKLLLLYRVWSNWMHDTAGVSLINGKVPGDFQNWVNFALNMGYGRLSTNERILLSPLREFLAKQSDKEVLGFFGHTGRPAEIKATGATNITTNIPTLADLGVQEDQKMHLTDVKLLLLYRVWSNWMHDTAGVSLINGRVSRDFGRWVHFALDMNYSRLSTNERILLKPLREFLASLPKEAQAFFGHFAKS